MVSGQVVCSATAANHDRTTCQFEESRLTRHNLRLDALRKVIRRRQTTHIDETCVSKFAS